MNYLLTIEFRYVKKTDDDSDYVSKTLTLGVFETRDDANNAGNKVLTKLESRFTLNKHHNRKQRFSNNGGCFGYPTDLISELGYLETPFQFFAKITKLNYGCIDKYIDDALTDIKG